MSPPSFRALRIALVGPLAPPAGGMANQTAQLAALLRAAGASVELVQVNPPWRPAWLARWRGVRAACRLPLYLGRLWRAAGRAELLHVMANSGWAWHLHAAPAIWIGWLRGKAVLVNYRGGLAPDFLARRRRLIAFTLARADATVVPSAWLAEVFGQHGLSTQIVPNIIDLARFKPAPRAPDGPVILIARHLEALYGIDTGLRAFAMLRQTVPQARLVVAGGGSELPALQLLARQLQLGASVHFTGALDNAAMLTLYQNSTLLLNPSLADNMPVSLLEALACGIPVVSTAVGGVPHLIEHQVHGLLVAPADPAAMADAMRCVLRHPMLVQGMVAAGLALVRQYSWEQVAPRLLAQYQRVLGRPRGRLYGGLVSGCLFPLQERFKRHDSVRRLAELEHSQWWPAARIEALQLERLRRLLLRAGTSVPYYRKLFAAHRFDPARFNDLSQLQALPLLRKADITARRSAFIAADAGPLQRFNTGGSSGEPLIFYLGRERISHDVAAKWRATRWWGVDIGDREAVLWGSPIELSAQDRWRAARDAVLRTTLLPAFAMSTERLDRYLARLRQLRPRMLFGYPSALSLLARHARARAVPLDRLGVRVAFVTAERLYPEQRAVISQVFGCPVANGYGGRDAGFIAHECEQGGMHISAEDVLVEIVDSRGRQLPPGSSGNIVVTHLASGDFPFIRYVTGDVGALGQRPCACGRGLPLLQQIEGRQTDFLVAQDGTVMHGLALIYILRDLVQVRAYKIIQESLQLTRVLLVCVPALDAGLRQTIVAGFRARLGGEVEIAIEEVAEIAAEASGKYRYVISKIAPH